jgi:hypothetical protein
MRAIVFAFALFFSSFAHSAEFRGITQEDAYLGVSYTLQKVQPEHLTGQTAEILEHCGQYFVVRKKRGEDPYIGLTGRMEFFSKEHADKLEGQLYVYASAIVEPLSSIRVFIDNSLEAPLALRPWQDTNAILIRMSRKEFNQSPCLRTEAEVPRL